MIALITSSRRDLFPLFYQSRKDLRIESSILNVQWTIETQNPSDMEDDSMALSHSNESSSTHESFHTCQKKTKYRRDLEIGSHFENSSADKSPFRVPFQSSHFENSSAKKSPFKKHQFSACVTCILLTASFLLGCLNLNSC